MDDMSQECPELIDKDMDTIDSYLKDPVLDPDEELKISKCIDLENELVEIPENPEHVIELNKNMGVFDS